MKMKHAAALFALLCLPSLAFAQTPVGNYAKYQRQVSTAPTPPTGSVNAWVRDSDGHMCTINSSGTVIDLASGGGGGGISLPNGEIGYGNGSSITSDPSFTYRPNLAGQFIDHVFARAPYGVSMNSEPSDFDMGSGSQAVIIASDTGASVKTGNAYEFDWTLDGAYVLAPSSAAAVAGGLHYNVGTSTLQFSNDGSTWHDVGTGGGVSWPLTNSTSTNTYSSAVTDSSSAVAHDFNTTHAFSTAGDKLLRIRNNGTEEAFFDRNGGLNFGAAGANGQIVPAGSGINYTSDSDSVFTWGGQNLTYSVTFHTIYPNLELVGLGGAPSNRWGQVSSYMYDTKLGAQLTAASTITPTSALHHITGATPMTTIAVTNLTAGNVTFTAICDSTTCTFSTGGNIASATTISQNAMRAFVYDAAGTTWYPEQ